MVSSCVELPICDHKTLPRKWLQCKHTVKTSNNAQNMTQHSRSKRDSSEDQPVRGMTRCHKNNIPFADTQ